MAVKDDMRLAKELAKAIGQRGGRVYFVGGCVRDGLMGFPVKDLDVEVYGVSPSELRQALSGLGEVMEKGAAFGVLGLKHSDLDVAMPRRESLTGPGHRDFDVSVDPSLSTREASRRRDFTVNAMMRDALTGEIIDHWGGRQDLAAGVLRMVSGETFGEDALRAFRAAQFSARFRMEIEPETMARCREMDVTSLSRERVFEETVKALQKADAPSAFFEALARMDHLKEFFPELLATVGIRQNPAYHPEGDVFRHTMLVVDEAAKLRDRAEQPLWFMFAALLHDLGKVEATRTLPEGKIVAYGHEVQGLEMVERQIRRLTDNQKLVAYVLNMVKLHMQPNLLARCKSRKVKTRMLFDASLCPGDLILLSRADASGKRDAPYDEGLEKWLSERYADYRAVASRPMVTGADLAKAGVAPGPAMGEMIARARRLTFGGLEKARALRQVLGEYCSGRGQGDE